MMQPGFAEAARVLLESIPGENPSRDGLVRTPERFAKAMSFLLQGYGQDVSEVISPDTIFDDDHKEPIVVKDINVFSLCEHHMLPFYGRVHVAYIPRDGKIVGLSKLARLTELFARRLQVQERLTRQIAGALEKTLCPLGIGVIVECTHLCMSMRGVRSVDSTTITSVKHGCFEEDGALWRDFWGQVFQCQGTKCMSPSSSDATISSSLASSSCVGNSPGMCCLCSSPIQAQGINHVYQPDASSNADDYRLYTKCSHEEFDKMTKLIKDSMHGPVMNTRSGGLSLLDIGAGTGHVLKKLMSASVNIVPSKYVAFEPDADVVQDLNKMLLSNKCMIPSYEVVNASFDTSVSVSDVRGPFDVVLLSHVLYGCSNAQTQELFEHSLKFVAPGGVLLVFHHCDSKKLDILRRYMVEERMIFHQQDYSVQVNVAALSPSEVSRIEAYTKSKSSQDGSINRNICFIAIEPSSCRPVDGQQMKCILQERKVSYAARSIVPAAICTPNSVVGIQACLRAASEKTFGFNSVSVIGGGHSANCVVADALAINMSRWKSVEVRPEEMVVCVGGGATCGEITLAAEKKGLAVPLGDRPGVGVGLILAGGINHFMRKFGLTIDNIIRLVYVSPSGHLCVAEGEAELMPFRGAGANFGVVVEITLQAHKVGTITNRHSEYSFKEWSPSSNILGAYSSYAKDLVLSECVDAFVFYKADELVFATSRFHFGEEHKEHQFSDEDIFCSLPCLKSLTHGNTMSHSLPSDLYDHELYMTKSFAVQNATLSEYPKNCKLRSVKRCLFFQTLRGNAETELIDSMTNSPTSWCYVHILHGGGKVKEVAARSSSFCARDWDFAAVITGRWPDGDKNLHKLSNDWVKLTTKRLLPYAVGIYSTDLGPDDHELRHLAYERQNLIPLAELKQRQDPLMVLRHSCPLIDWPAKSSSHSRDPLGQSRGAVILVCGRRHSGKDWLGSIIQTQLTKLIGEHAKARVNLVSISEGTKLAYAKEFGLDGDLLLRSRAYKEQHRRSILEFYESRKVLDPAFDRKCFVEAVQKYSNGCILILTGLRDGVDYARLLSGRPTLFILVKAGEESKMRRGWNGYVKGIDEAEGSIDNMHPDLVYDNDRDSTVATASSWVVQELAPAIVKACVREVKDVPRPGIVYKDIIGGLLVQPFGMSLVSSLIASQLECSTDHVDAVLAPEALGFILAGQVASSLCLPLLLARKVQPVFGTFHETDSNGSNMSNLSKSSLTNDRGNAHKFFMVAGTVLPGQRVLVVDDCLATGATLNALDQLVSSQGATVVKLITLMEMVDPELKGRDFALERGIDVVSLTCFKGK